MHQHSLARNLWDHLRGHVLLFDRRDPPACAAAAGVRLLLIFVLLELAIGPRMSLLPWIGVPAPPLAVRTPIMLAAALALVRFAARVPLPAIGLRPFREWSRTERSYLLQASVIAAFVFSAVLADRWRTAAAEGTTGGHILHVAVPYFVFGFYQEVMYRGILQTELRRRLGVAAAIAVSNVAYTFGPLHLYYFSQDVPVAGMFAATFTIGLYFAVLYHRAGNLWLPAILHGVGNAFMQGGAPN